MERDDLDFDLAAAGLRADGAEVATGIEVLAAKLEDALPAQTSVRRRARRLLSRDKAVEAVDVRLGEWHYALQVRDGHAEAAREQAVRGVVIRREPLDLGAWVRALTEQLREQAATSAAARGALERLVG